MFIASPSGERPPKLKRPIGLWVATAPDALPEASRRAQVEAAHARGEALA